MATLKQVEQVLELALSLVSEMEGGKSHEVKNLQIIASHIQEKLKSSLCEKIATNTSNNPIDVLLKKGKVELPPIRYKQLTQIHHELSVLKIKFLSAKQNPYIIWFPLEWNGDKSAALYLSSSEWSVAPIKYRDDNDLTGEWEGFDLTGFMAMNCPKFDQDEY
jgi:hypothetical protein